MKLERRLKRSTKELSLELTSLIDVVFLLLIFFLVATTFEDVNTGIKIDLPKSTAQDIADIKGLQILIQDNKNITLNYRENGKNTQLKVNKDDLKKELADRLTSATDKSVLISADKKIDYGFMVDIMTIVRESGATSMDLDTARMK